MRKLLGIPDECLLFLCYIFQRATYGCKCDFSYIWLSLLYYYRFLPANLYLQKSISMMLYYYGLLPAIYGCICGPHLYMIIYSNTIIDFSQLHMDVYADVTGPDLSVTKMWTSVMKWRYLDVELTVPVSTLLYVLYYFIYLRLVVLQYYARNYAMVNVPQIFLVPW